MEDNIRQGIEDWRRGVALVRSLVEAEPEGAVRTVLAETNTTDGRAVVAYAVMELVRLVRDGCAPVEVDQDLECRDGNLVTALAHGISNGADPDTFDWEA